MNDWMDRVAARAAERLEQERRQREQELNTAELLLKLAPRFAAAVFDSIDTDVNRWNERPSSQNIIGVTATDDTRCFLYYDRALTVRYSYEMQMIDVDIAVGNEKYVAPNIVANSYLLLIQGKDIVAKRHGTSDRGVISAPEKVSEEILTALLS